MAVFGVFRYENKLLDGSTGQNLQALDQTINLRGHSLLYNDILLTFKAVEATFSVLKIGIFWGQNSAIFGTFFSSRILTSKNAYFGGRKSCFGRLESQQNIIVQ